MSLHQVWAVSCSPALMHWSRQAQGKRVACTVHTAQLRGLHGVRLTEQLHSISAHLSSSGTNWKMWRSSSCDSSSAGLSPASLSGPRLGAGVGDSSQSMVMCAMPSMPQDRQRGPPVKRGGVGALVFGRACTACRHLESATCLTTCRTHATCARQTDPWMQASTGRRASYNASSTRRARMCQEPVSQLGARHACRKLRAMRISCHDHQRSAWHAGSAHRR